MGRFSKTLAQKILFEWQDSYIYYNSIKKIIRHHKTETATLQAIVFSPLNTQLQRVHASFQAHSALLQEKVSQIFSYPNDRCEYLHGLLRDYLHLISFSYWNIRIVFRCLSRLKEFLPNSQSDFIHEHSDLLLSLQNLPQFNSWLSILTSEISTLSPEELSSTPLQSPLLNSKLDNYQRDLISNLLVKAKDDYSRHEGIEFAPKESDYPDLMTLLLTVFSSFIHLTNFYVLSLAAKDYSVHVGMNESFSGILSGANWMSSVFFTFTYSYWSNYQFKIPTLVCAFFTILGNVVYFSAYSYASPLMLVAGRLLVGVGGARVINRRYISSYVAPQARTAWNSAYVAGSIVGRGVGPIVGAGLFFVDFEVLGISVNGLNSPALFMGIVWLIYFTLVLIYFQEPEIKVLTAEHIEKSKEQSMIPTYVTLFALIVPKIVHEAYVTSVPIFAEAEFGWHVDFIGVYIAAVSLAVAPVHIFIAFTSKIFQDRQFIRVALILTALGCVLLIDFDDISQAQYIAGTIVMYIGMNLDDGVTASLLSKVLPAHLAVGIFNPGLLITFCGSLARGIGGFTIAVAGLVENDGEDIENVLFVPLAGLAIVACAIFLGFYRYINPQKINNN